MSCSPFELKDYFLQELTAAEAAQVEDHARRCAACREELERLRLTGAALFSLRDEEIPQRIGFVSDKIFEPSPVRRLWAAFWGSSGRLGFAGAAMLSAAIVFSSVNKPVQAPAPGTAAIQKVADVPAQLSEEQIQARIDLAVAKAVDQAVNQTAATKQLVADLRHENEVAHAQLVRVAGDLDVYRMRDRNRRLEGLVLPPSGEGR